VPEFSAQSSRSLFRLSGFSSFHLDYREAEPENVLVWGGDDAVASPPYKDKADQTKKTLPQVINSDTELYTLTKAPTGPSSLNDRSLNEHQSQPDNQSNGDTATGDGSDEDHRHDLR
jgi:hypothetical protein